MYTFQIALKNFKKNFSFYFLYFISITLIVTIFFSFTSFSGNQIMLERLSTDGRVESMCQLISIFLILFIIFYMSYSNRFFLRRRTKELGIYALLGYKKTVILSLLTFENSFICIMSLIFGILLGGLAHKSILFIINELLHLGINHIAIPFISLKALCQTVLFIGVVLLVLTLSNARFLYQSSLIQLVRFEKSVEKNMTFHKVPAWLGFIMMITGYLMALDILKVKHSIWIKIGFYPVGLVTLFLVILGTILFIYSFLPYIIQKSKYHTKSFYTPIKFITLSNFIYRIRSNAKTLIALTLLSAATLTISSVMALTLYYPIATMNRITPSDIEFRIENEMQLEEVRQIIKHYVPNLNDMSLLKTSLYKMTSSSKDLPIEYSLGSSEEQHNQALRKAGFECMSYSQYVALLKAQNKKDVLKGLHPLKDDQCILIKYQVDHTNAIELNQPYPLTSKYLQKTVYLQAISYDNVLSFANSVGTLILSDSLYHEISQYEVPITQIISLNGKAIHNNEALYQALYRYFNASPYLQSYFHRVNEVIHLNSSTFLLIGFLVVFFFIAAGSTLYFNTISSIIDSKSDYDTLEKIGYTKTQIKWILKRQIMTFYSIPFFLGLLDCFFATIVFKIGLMQDLLASSFIQYLPVLISTLITIFIYSIYYTLTVKSCHKIVFK